MILDNLKNSKRIEGLDSKFTELFEYVGAHNLLDMPLGRIELDGDNFFINNVESECVDMDSQALETHKDYLDVHILLSGEETIGWRALSTMESVKTEYDDQTDLAFWNDKPTSYVNMVPGEFVIFYPEDAHAPLIGKGKIRKAIVKIKL